MIRNSQLRMKPAPHVRPDGSITRPVPPTFIEALQRAVEPNAPIWSRQAWDSFLEGLHKCPQRRADLAAILADEIANREAGR